MRIRTKTGRKRTGIRGEGNGRKRWLRGSGRGGGAGKYCMIFLIFLKKIKDEGGL
jgi:hypothetical protein